MLLLRAPEACLVSFVVFSIMGEAGSSLPTVLSGFVGIFVNFVVLDQNSTGVTGTLEEISGFDDSIFPLMNTRDLPLSTSTITHPIARFYQGCIN